MIESAVGSVASSVSTAALKNAALSFADPKDLEKSIGKMVESLAGLNTQIGNLPAEEFKKLELKSDEDWRALFGTAIAKNRSAETNLEKLFGNSKPKQDGSGIM